jgi:hypothetical protein
MRILQAAHKHRIMPLGFVGVQLRPEQNLPRGRVTFALIDIEASTELLQRLGPGYGRATASRMALYSMSWKSAYTLDAK